MVHFYHLFKRQKIKFRSRGCSVISSPIKIKQNFSDCSMHNSCFLCSNNCWNSRKYRRWNSHWLGLNQEFIFISLVQHIPRTLSVSFRNIDDKTQSILSTILQNTKKEVDHSDYTSRHKYCLKTYHLINLYRHIICKWLDKESRWWLLVVPNVESSEPIHRLHTASLCDNLLGDAVIERAIVHGTQ